MNYQKLREELMLDEGVRLHAYKDTEGNMTIGVGRNLTSVGLSKDEVQILLDNDINTAISALDQSLPWWRTMNEVRQHVLVNMCFNLGVVRLMGFKLALAAMESGGYSTAAEEMKSSKWAAQVGPRATRLILLMRLGE